MASVMGLPIQDYGCYAVSHALHHLHIDLPQLFEKPDTFIANSLEDDYCYVSDSFPSSQSRETTHQRKERNAMVQQWLEDLDQLLGVDWLGREILKINTLNALFYSIWNIHWRRPTSALATQASSATNGQMTSNVQPILSAKNASMNRLHTGDNSVQIVEDVFKSGGQSFGNIRPAEILEYALTKVGELHDAR
jgi:hypothetical protein